MAKTALKTIQDHAGRLASRSSTAPALPAATTAPTAAAGANYGTQLATTAFVQAQLPRLHHLAVHERPAGDHRSRERDRDTSPHGLPGLPRR